MSDFNFCHRQDDVIGMFLPPDAMLTIMPMSHDAPQKNETMTSRLLGIVLVFPDPRHSKSAHLVPLTRARTVLAPILRGEEVRSGKNSPRIADGLRALLLGEAKVLRCFELE